MGDTDTVSALGVGARHYGFKKTSPQSYWPGKEHTHCDLGRIWERPFLAQKYSLMNLAGIQLSKKTLECQTATCECIYNKVSSHLA